MHTHTIKYALAYRFNCFCSLYRAILFSCRYPNDNVFSHSLMRNAINYGAVLRLPYLHKERQGMPPELFCDFLPFCSTSFNRFYCLHIMR